MKANNELRLARSRLTGGRSFSYHATCAAVSALLCAVAGYAQDSTKPRLILISVDGLRPDAVTETTAPNITALRASGFWAANAFNDLPSATLPNHATMLTGLVVDRHGLILNINLPGTIPQRTLFDYAAEAGLRSVFFASKTKLGHLAPPQSLEIIDIAGDTGPLIDRLLPRISPDGPDLLFVHLRDPDSVGHAQGWLSPAYFEAVGHVDELIGRLVAAAGADESRDTYFIVTADHGGEGMNHFLNVDANRRIPWIAIGPGIRGGDEIIDVVSIADTTPTVLWLLGQEVPSGLSGRVVREIKSTAGGDALAAAPIAPLGLPCVIFGGSGLVGTCLFAVLTARRRRYGDAKARGGRAHRALR